MRMPLIMLVCPLTPPFGFGESSLTLRIVAIRFLDRSCSYGNPTSLASIVFGALASGGNSEFVSHFYSFRVVATTQLLITLGYALIALWRFSLIWFMPSARPKLMAVLRTEMNPSCVWASSCSRLMGSFMVSSICSLVILPPSAGIFGNYLTVSTGICHTSFRLLYSSLIESSRDNYDLGMCL